MQCKELVTLALRVRMVLASQCVLMSTALHPLLLWCVLRILKFLAQLHASVQPFPFLSNTLFPIPPEADFYLDPLTTTVLANMLFPLSNPLTTHFPANTLFLFPTTSHHIPSS